MNRKKPSIWKNLNPRPLGNEATTAALRAMKPHHHTPSKYGKQPSKYGSIYSYNLNNLRAVVVAHMVKRLLLEPEIRGSITDIGKILSTNCTI